MQCTCHRLRQCRRTYTTLGHGQPQTEQLRHNLRRLLREIAQPVAIVTTTATSPSSNLSPSATEQSIDKRHLYHGATLASLNSISLSPYPLLSFSLRLPSRLASALKPPTPDSPPKRAVINYPSTSQAHIAHAFARGDVSHDPFTALSNAVSRGDGGRAYFLDEHGVPVLTGCLGAVSCEVLVPGLALKNQCYLRSLSLTGQNEVIPTEKEAEAQSYECESSELFIVRATKVLYGLEDDRPGSKSPLLYHNRTYRKLDAGLLSTKPE